MRFLLTEEDLDSIHRVKHCAWPDVERATLNGVVVAPGWVSATDGYRCAFVETDGVARWPLLIHLDSLKDLPSEGECVLDVGVFGTGTSARYGTQARPLRAEHGDHVKCWATATMEQTSRVSHSITFDLPALIYAVRHADPAQGAVGFASHVPGVKATMWGEREAEVRGGPDRWTTSSYPERGGVIVVRHPEPRTPRSVRPAPEVSFLPVPSNNVWMPETVVERKFFLQCLRAVHGERVTLSVHTPRSGVWITAEDDPLVQCLLPLVGWKDIPWN